MERSTRQLSRGYAAVFATVAIWSALTSQFWIVSVAMHHQLPFDSSYFISGTTTVGLAIPTPGGVGGFHKVCQVILTNFYAFDIDTSVAAALLFHIVGTLPVVVAGIILFATSGISLKEAKADRHDA